MKKITLFSATILSLVLLASPLALVATSTADSTFDYQPYSVPTYVGPLTTDPLGVPLCHSGLVCYSPGFIRSAYNFPTTLDGTGQTIVIVDAFGSPTIANDLATFDAVFGLPAPPSFTIVCPPGGCPSPSLGAASANAHNGGNKHAVFSWSIETSLDVEYAHAMAPGANIVLAVAMTSSGNDINVIESKVIPMFPGAIMSQSFGIPEAVVNGNNIQFQQAESNYAEAQSLGWTVFASAGDSGATNGFATPNAGFPASSPLVTSVGGTQGDPYHTPFAPFGGCSGICSAGLANFDNSTGICHFLKTGTLNQQCPSAGYSGEQVWNEPVFAAPGNLATGGGAPSMIFGTPSYQNGLGLSSRTVPDVSYNAAIDGGVLVIWSAFPQLFGAPPGTIIRFIVGGTSAGSPQWAAIAALANQKAGHSLGFINPAIYSIGNNAGKYANDFHDITVGNNQASGTPAGFPATTGWDDATGWGTPNVTNLVNDLSV